MKIKKIGLILLTSLGLISSLMASSLKIEKDFPGQFVPPDGKPHTQVYKNNTGKIEYVRKIVISFQPGYSYGDFEGFVYGSLYVTHASPILGSGYFMEWQYFATQETQTGLGPMSSSPPCDFSPDYLELDPGDSITFAMQCQGFSGQVTPCWGYLWYTTTP